jgi:hypothetical protein
MAASAIAACRQGLDQAVKLCRQFVGSFFAMGLQVPAPLALMTLLQHGEPDIPTQHSTKLANLNLVLGLQGSRVGLLLHDKFHGLLNINSALLFPAAQSA